ncbi:MAG: MarR family transcriptional regulator [Myxococcota bacterium]
MSDSRLLRSVQRLASALGRLERQTASRAGVTVSQLRVLSCLDQASSAPGVRIGTLADDQGLAISTMTRNVALLERRGWVRRESGEEDRRTVRVVLTEVGRQKALELQDTTLSRFQRAFRAFHPTDRVERAVALDRVAEALENNDGSVARKP